MIRSERNLFMGAKELIIEGKTALGIELGSTRIKGVLIDYQGNVLAVGIHDWENSFIDNIWTYSLAEIHAGVRDCYNSLRKIVEETYGVTLKKIGSIGVSAMMHGYMALDKEGRQIAPFQTWRNTNTQQAADELTELFDFNIPLRWTVAHLYQRILDGEKHVEKLDYVSTLSGYIHWKLTGERVIGVGDAAGKLAAVPSQFQRLCIGGSRCAEAGAPTMGLHRIHNGIIVAEDLAPQGVGCIHPLQGLVIAHRFHINMVEAAVPLTGHHLPNEDLRGIGPGHLLRCTLYICPPAAANGAVIAVAHNAADLPLHLTGRKGMPVRQSQVIPPCIVMIGERIVVFLWCAGFDAVSYLALPGVQTPELRVAGSPYPVAKPQIQYTVAPVTAGLQGII